MLVLPKLPIKMSVGSWKCWRFSGRFILLKNYNQLRQGFVGQEL